MIHFTTSVTEQGDGDWTMSVLCNNLVGVIPYTAHGAQITPSLIFFLTCFYAYFRLVRSGKGWVCPAGLGKRLVMVPQG